MSRIGGKIRLLAPPLTGERRENAKKYKRCVAKYAKGTYLEGVWTPLCKKDCANCVLGMTKEEYLGAMRDVAARL